MSTSSIPAGYKQPVTDPSSTACLERALGKLDQLFAAETANQESRSRSRRKAPPTTSAGDVAKAQACSACRKRKLKCLPNPDGQDCARCVEGKLPCIWPELGVRGPKKGFTKTQRLLNSIRMDILKVMNGEDSDSSSDDSDSSTPGASTSTRSQGRLDEQGTSRQLLDRPSVVQRNMSDISTTTAVDSEDLNNVLRNPFGIFAGNHPLLEAQLPKPGQSSSSIGGYSQYYDGGIYQEALEDEMAWDPVSLGVIAHEELERLLQIYFTLLRPFFWHLDPDIHTAAFLRANSPFLTSAVAAVAATFDPLLREKTPVLQRHVEATAVRCFEAGWKSVEVVQAFCFMAHWASPGRSWNEDRSWAWHGQAIRIAKEIRMDLPLPLESFDHYRTVCPPTKQDFERLRDLRERTWALAIQSEVYQGMQTGRVEGIVSLFLSGVARSEIPISKPDDPYYNCNALNALIRVVCRALHVWEGLRDKIEKGETVVEPARKLKESWERPMEDWKRSWPEVNAYVRMFADTTIISFHLIAIRFPGSQNRIDILHLCRSKAVRNLQEVSTWNVQDASLLLPYVSNFVIVGMAFSAVFLLKLANLLDSGPTPELEASCLHLASILENIAVFRPEGTSIAGLHADRIRFLLAKSQANLPQSSLTLNPPVALQENFTPIFGPGDAFEGLSDDILSFSWPDATTFEFFSEVDPMMGFRE